MNAGILAILLFIGVAFAGNYTIDHQVTGLQNQNNSGNSSNYSVNVIFPFSPQPASGGNYSATVGIEILGIALPSQLVPLFCSIQNMTLSGLQTIQNQYSAITSPFTLGLTYILGIIFILSGIILLWNYALKDMPGWPKIQLPRIRF